MFEDDFQRKIINGIHAEEFNSEGKQVERVDIACHGMETHCVIVCLFFLDNNCWRPRIRGYEKTSAVRSDSLHAEQSPHAM